MKPQKYHVVDRAQKTLRSFFLKNPAATFLSTLVLLGVVFLLSDLVACRRADSLSNLSDDIVAEEVSVPATIEASPSEKTTEASSPSEGSGEVSSPLPIVDPADQPTDGQTDQPTDGQTDEPTDQPLALPSPGPLVSAEPGEIRVADWNICWFPSGRPEPSDELAELITIRAAAKVVRKLEPHILCAEEIRSADIAERFAQAIKLPDFRLAVCSAYTNYDGTAGTQQTAVFSTFPVLKSKCDAWHTVGYIDPPRGYAFALLDAPGGPIGVFAIHLKSNYVNPDAENPDKLAYINRLKRQFASDQVRALVDEWLASGFVPADTRFLVAGDFNTAEHDKRWRGETTLSAFRKAGWRSCYDGMKREDCYTLPADPLYGYDAVTFDYIFTRGFAGQRATQIHPVPGRISDHAVVTTLLR